MALIYQQVNDDIGLPQEVFRETKAYFNDVMAIFQPDYLVNNGANIIDSYHFVIPSSKMPPLRVDNKFHEICANQVFVTDPGQNLLNTREMPVTPYTAVFIDKTYLNQIAYLGCGTGEIHFHNGSYSLSPLITPLIQRFIFEHRHQQTGYEMILEAITTEIIILLLRGTKHSGSHLCMAPTFRDNKNISRAIEFLMEHYHEEISLKTLSQIANLSPYHFIRVFKGQTGKTPYQFLIDIKIQKAVYLLCSTQHSVTEITAMCGFANPSHFAVLFKKKAGLTPSEYRKAFSQ